jgi:hypothetical protein
MPSVTAPISEWEGWVTDWNESLNAQDIATSFKEAGCTVTNVEVTPIPESAAVALGFPAGIDPDGGTFVTSCTNSNSHGRLRPMSTPGIGSSEGTVGGLGNEYVDSCTVNDSNSVCATYTYLEDYPEYLEGHAELSTDGAFAMTCSVGTLVQNSGNVSLSYGQDANAFDPSSPTGSNVWNGNFWTPDSSPYSNEGNVCALI